MKWLRGIKGNLWNNIRAKDKIQWKNKIKEKRQIIISIIHTHIF